MAAKFAVAVRNIAAISLKLGYPTLASLPHSIANAFKTILAVTVQLDTFSFPKADPFKVGWLGEDGIERSYASSACCESGASLIAADDKLGA
jgi:large subunit ribosomal protein LP0